MRGARKLPDFPNFVAKAEGVRVASLFGEGPELLFPSKDTIPGRRSAGPVEKEKE